MLLNNYYFLDNIFFYIELNNYLIGTSINVFKYKFNDNFFFYFESKFFYFNFYFFFNFNYSKWKLNNYLFFLFLINNLYNKIHHLKLEGRGYKLYYYLNYVIFKLGYSHLCYYLLPINVYFYSKKKKSYYKLISSSNEIAGNVLSRMQLFRIPNTYKKKGIFIT